MTTHPTHGNPRRNRWVCAALVGCLILLGLGSRSSAAQALPKFIAEYSGDTLWAMMVYCLACTLFPGAVPLRIAFASAAFAGSVELSQLSDAAVLEWLRNLPAMRLVLGYGFLWSDLACYAVGIGLAYCIDRASMIFGGERPGVSVQQRNRN